MFSCTKLERVSVRCCSTTADCERHNSSRARSGRWREATKGRNHQVLRHHDADAQVLSSGASRSQAGPQVPGRRKSALIVTARLSGPAAAVGPIMQRWTWVTFSSPNRTRPTSIQTQRNPSYQHMDPPNPPT